MSEATHTMNRAEAIEAAANSLLAIWKTKEACNALRALDKALALPAEPESELDAVECTLADEEAAHQETLQQLTELRAENERLRDAMLDVMCDPGHAELSEYTFAKCQAMRGAAVEDKYAVVLKDELKSVEAENERLRKAIESFGNGNQFDWNVLKKIDDLEQRAEQAEALLRECGKAWQEFGHFPAKLLDKLPWE